MMTTRRDFIKASVALGCSFLLRNPFLHALENRDSGFHPAYGKLEEEGKLAARVEQAYTIFEECRLCPRECGVDRLSGEKGFCRTGTEVVMYSAHPHFGEEVPLVGRTGSGTIFFSNCNLRCVFCQNWPIAHKGLGDTYNDEALAAVMLRLQRIGCHNINLVTPTHVMPNILRATRLAYLKGLRIPLVYNTSGYESADIVNMLDSVVDIYLPDMKFMDNQQADLYLAGAKDYPEIAKQAVLEMHRQVGLPVTDAQGVAQRGLFIRHLVMPNRVAGTRQFVKWVSETLPKATYVNIMSQYHVAFKAFDYPQIWRSITAEEYLEAMKWADEYGLTNLDAKSLMVRDFYTKQ